MVDGDPSFAGRVAVLAKLNQLLFYLFITQGRELLALLPAVFAGPGFTQVS